MTCRAIPQPYHVYRTYRVCRYTGRESQQQNTTKYSTPSAPSDTVHSNVSLRRSLLRNSREIKPYAWMFLQYSESFWEFLISQLADDMLLLAATLCRQVAQLSRQISRRFPTALAATHHLPCWSLKDHESKGKPGPEVSQWAAHLNLTIPHHTSPSFTDCFPKSTEGWGPKAPATLLSLWQRSAP